MSVKIRVETSEDGSIATSCMMHGRHDKCMCECAVIPAAVIQQYETALKQQGLSDDIVMMEILKMYYTMIDYVKDHFEYIKIGDAANES